MYWREHLMDLCYCTVWIHMEIIATLPPHTPRSRQTKTKRQITSHHHAGMYYKCMILCKTPIVLKNSKLALHCHWVHSLSYIVFFSLSISFYLIDVCHICKHTSGDSSALWVITALLLLLLSLLFFVAYITLVRTFLMMQRCLLLYRRFCVCVLVSCCCTIAIILLRYFTVAVVVCINCCCSWYCCVSLLSSSYLHCIHCTFDCFLRIIIWELKGI